MSILSNVIGGRTGRSIIVDPVGAVGRIGGTGGPCSNSSTTGVVSGSAIVRDPRLCNVEEAAIAGSDPVVAVNDVAGLDAEN